MEMSMECRAIGAQRADARRWCFLWFEGGLRMEVLVRLKAMLLRIEAILF